MELDYAALAKAGAEWVGHESGVELHQKRALACVHAMLLAAVLPLTVSDWLTSFSYWSYTKCVPHACGRS